MRRNHKASVKFNFDYRKKWANPPWYSSYETSNYGDLFYALIRLYRPQTVVELGTKAGYSAYHIARGLKANGKGTLDCYDLWEKYEFNSVPQSIAATNLKKFASIITLNLRNAIGVDKLYDTIDILHVDISNDGEKLEQIIPPWIDKVRQLIIIAGGSTEHDQLPWITHFNKMPMRQWLKNFHRRYKDVECLTLQPFPSITLIRNRNNE